MSSGIEALTAVQEGKVEEWAKKYLLKLDEEEARDKKLGDLAKYAAIVSVHSFWEVANLIFYRPSELLLGS